MVQHIAQIDSVVLIFGDKTTVGTAAVADRQQAAVAASRVVERMAVHEEVDIELLVGIVLVFDIADYFVFFPYMFPAAVNLPLRPYDIARGAGCGAAFPLVGGIPVRHSVLVAQRFVELHRIGHSEIAVGRAALGLAQQGRVGRDFRAGITLGYHLGETAVVVGVRFVDIEAQGYVCVGAFPDEPVEIREDNVVGSSFARNKETLGIVGVFEPVESYLNRVERILLEQVYGTVVEQSPVGDDRMRSPFELVKFRELVEQIFHNSDS